MEVCIVGPNKKVAVSWVIISVFVGPKTSVARRFGMEHSIANPVLVSNVVSSLRFIH